MKMSSLAKTYKKPLQRLIRLLKQASNLCTPLVDLSDASLNRSMISV